MRAGVFSELPGSIFDPAATVCPNGANCTRQPFAGNLIPSNRISSASKFFQAPLPAPTHSGIANNFLNNNKGVGFNNVNATVKVDINATDAHPFSGLFTPASLNHSRAIPTTPVPLPPP